MLSSTKILNEFLKKVHKFAFQTHAEVIVFFGFGLISRLRLSIDNFDNVTLAETEILIKAVSESK